MDCAAAIETKEGEEKSSSSIVAQGQKSQDEEDSYSICPLFMDGLPHDFASNPALAAIANLLEDDEDEEIKKSSQMEGKSKETFLPGGGGKITTKKKHSRRSKPYICNQKKKKASIGEAQLFMKMWKL